MKGIDMKKTENDIQIREFTDFIRAVGSEIEQAQVRLISAANVQMLMHYWKLGHFILFAQKQLGWGGKVIEKISKAIRDKYPEKKGYSPRNLKYMCQFAKIYPLDILKQMLFADEELQTLSVEKVLVLTKSLNEYEVCRHEIIPFIARNEIGQQPVAQFQNADIEGDTFGQQPAAQIQYVAKTLSLITQQPAAQIQNTELDRNKFMQEPPAQIQDVSKTLTLITQEHLAKTQNTDLKRNIFGQQPPAQIQDVAKTLSLITQEPLAQIEQIFINSPISKINWASHVVLMDSNLPLGLRYWYIKEALEFGWSRNILAIQIETNLFKRQIASRKITNFTATIPQPQSDLANYLLKDPYIFDLANAKKSADERDIEEQLVTHVTKYLLEMGNGFAFVARQKHFQIGNSDFYADLILYNIKLRAYFVIELKATPFKPEHIGQLNFYVNVIDDKMRSEHDNKTIGLLLCKGKDEVVAQYALDGYTQPLGISDYQLSNAIPEDLKSTLPSIEEVEHELTQLLERNKK